MPNLTEQNLAEVVVRKLVNCRDPRLKTVMESLIRQLHAFVREVELKPEEWLAGIQFLTQTGRALPLCREGVSIQFGEAAS